MYTGVVFGLDQGTDDAGDRELTALAFERTEQRTPCTHYTPLKQPFFGDTHIHTGRSLDAYMQGARVTPADAYRFAKGEVLDLPTGLDTDSKKKPGPLAQAKISEPLDFAVVTDHAELFGEQRICESPDHPAYGAWQCKVYRNVPAMARMLFMSRMAKVPEPGEKIGHFSFCGENAQYCLDEAAITWKDVQSAAEQAYDRSEDCSFTSFVGYEWSASPQTKNLHRVVIYRNEKVSALPAESFTETTPKNLWDNLQSSCFDSVEGCDVLAIPHGSNISAGSMFELDKTADGKIDLELAAQRRDMEPLVEIFQRKGDAECSATADDELCSFEKLSFSNMSQNNLPKFAHTAPTENHYVRYALKKGVEVESASGINPFQYGVIGGTDTHMGIGGQVEEYRHSGHSGGGQGGAGRVDPDKALTSSPYYNPGGLAVVWAEENSRDAIFSNMRKREVYGTSGPRIVLRTFGGWDFDDAMCDSADFAAQGYERGVAMGSGLPTKPEGATAPAFAVSAQASGNDLQRIQIIKGWEEGGKTFEKVYEVAGNPKNGASVDLNTCQPQGQGLQSMCKVWRDPDFKPEQHAFYYTRVVENPSCRWHTYQCLEAKVQCDGDVPKGLKSCCTDDYPKTTQERAWSSPIWYQPEATTQ